MSLLVGVATGPRLGLLPSWHRAGTERARTTTGGMIADLEIPATDIATSDAFLAPRRRHNHPVSRLSMGRRVGECKNAPWELLYLGERELRGDAALEEPLSTPEGGWGTSSAQPRR